MGLSRRVRPALLASALHSLDHSLCSNGDNGAAPRKDLRGKERGSLFQVTLQTNPADLSSIPGDYNLTREEELLFKAASKFLRLRNDDAKI